VVDVFGIGHVQAIQGPVQSNRSHLHKGMIVRLHQTQGPRVDGAANKGRIQCLEEPGPFLVGLEKTNLR